MAIHSTWGGDFYTILHGGEGASRVSFTFAENPMMRWLWLSGWVAGAGALVGLWPAQVSEFRVSSFGFGCGRRPR